MQYKTIFTIASPEGYYQTLVLPAYKDFQNDNTSTRHALSVMIFGYHLYEKCFGHKPNMVSGDVSFSVDGNADIYFDICRKISNSTKHPNIKIQTEIQTGFSSAFSSAFSRPLFVSDPDLSHAPTSVDGIIDVIMKFWDQYFQQNPVTPG